MTPEQWQDSNARCMGMLLNGVVEDTRGNADEDVPEVLRMVKNSHHEPVHFELPAVATGGPLRRVFDTDRPPTDLDGLADADEAEPHHQHHYVVSRPSNLRAHPRV